MKIIPSISRKTSGRGVASMIKKRCVIRKGDEKKIRLGHEQRISFRRCYKSALLILLIRSAVSFQSAVR